MTSPENFGQQFTCPDCGGWMELGHEHISPFEHLAGGNMDAFHNSFDNLARAQRFAKGRELIEQGKRDWDARRTRTVNLADHADLLNHLVETAGHMTGHSAVPEMHGSYGHLEDHAPLEQLGIKMPKDEDGYYAPLKLRDLQKVHDWMHQNEDIPHVTEGKEHFHTDLSDPPPLATRY